MRIIKMKSATETSANPIVTPALKAVLKAYPSEILAQIVVL